MRLIGGIIAGALLLSGVCVSAQDNSQQSERVDGQGFSPEDDLDCALFVGGLLGSDDGVMTPDARQALISSMTYFLGRYEARSGTPINVALAERYTILLEQDLSQIEQTCGLRARGFGRRMELVGRVMVEVQSAAKASSEER